MSSRRILFSWIGHADLRAMAASLPDDEQKEVLKGVNPPTPLTNQSGPLKCLLENERFDEIHLLSDHSAFKNRHYSKWIGGDPVLHPVKLKNPTDYPEVFKVADSELASVVSVPRPHRLELCIHLSPGTPTMTAIWLLLGKSKYNPAIFFQTHEGKAWETNVPFDLMLEFVPQVLRDADARLQRLASQSPQDLEGFQGIIGDSESLRVAVGLAKRAAQRDVSVLLLGESGTGKEKFARAIHDASPRKEQKFVSINCAAISRELIESELFGHKKGSFTGASEDRVGAFKEADGGTLFLDEIGECDPAMQAKLLRVLQPPTSKPLLQRLFEARIELADTAIKKPELPTFDAIAELISQDIADLPDATISVKEKYKIVHTVRDRQVIHQFAPATVAMLKQDIAPLMQWRSVASNHDAYDFDLLVCELETELLRGTPRVQDLKGTLLNQLSQLSMHLNQVREKADTIAKIKGAEFWTSVNTKALEQVRLELRGIMKYRDKTGTPILPPRMLDVAEVREHVQSYDYKPKLDGLELAQYRNRVESVLRKLFDKNDVLQRIKTGRFVSESDLAELVSLVLTQEPDLDLSDLLDYYPETAGHLDLAIRSIIGLDPSAVRDHFNAFVQKHTILNSMQLRFLQMLQNHIAKYGSIEIERLYEEPFTSIASNSVDEIFGDEQIDDLLEIIGAFRPPPI